MVWRQFTVTFVIICALVAGAIGVSAQSVSPSNAAKAGLQQKIDQRMADIKNLEQEIASYQKQISELGTQASSLSATIKSLQLTQKKLEADIKVTQNRIAEKNLPIMQLGAQISDKEDTISDNRRIIVRSFATLNETGDRSLPELLLSKDSLSGAWDALESITTLQQGLTNHIGLLQSAKANLESNKKQIEKAKIELQSLGDQLNDQRSVVLNTAAEQNQLLKETRQSETEYQKILSQRNALKNTIEAELNSYIATLTGTVDVGSIPKSGKGVLAYPVDSVRITQYFGNTPFSTANPQIYKKNGHTGVDFAASVGTRILSAESGVVVGTGNTDLFCPRILYGKWIMVKHNNGLTTVYGHLSLSKVKVGQVVSRGETIAYSGNTGNTTGPHLHFEVFASDGVGLKTVKSCRNVSIPGLTKEIESALLNPLSYF